MSLCLWSVTITSISSYVAPSSFDETGKLERAEMRGIPRSHGSLKGRLQKNHFPQESRTLLQKKTWVYFTKVILPLPLLELRGDIPLTFTVNNWWGFLELKSTNI